MSPANETVDAAKAAITVGLSASGSSPVLAALEVVEPFITIFLAIGGFVLAYIGMRMNQKRLEMEKERHEMTTSRFNESVKAKDDDK